MEQLYAALISYIDIWGYTAIMIGMALESACMPVPSELIFGFAGYLVFMGKLNFTYTVAAGVIGGLLGSIAAYGAGYSGGRQFIDKYGKYILLSHKHVDLAQKWFDRYGIKATFYSRLLPVVRTFISLPAGFARVNFQKFVIYTVLGSLPWTMALVYGGYLLGENWHKLEDVGHNIALVVAGFLLVVGIVWWKRNRGEVDPG